MNSSHTVANDADRTFTTPKEEAFPEGRLDCQDTAEAEHGKETTAGLSEAHDEDCIRLLHRLSNVVTGVLLNAQILDWKLPPYSLLKRTAREIECNSQRAAELTRQLLCRFTVPCIQPDPVPTEDTHALLCRRSSALQDTVAVTAQGPEALAALPKAAVRPTTPVFLQPSGQILTPGCDGRPSKIFPKRDDRDER